MYLAMRREQKRGFRIWPVASAVVAGATLEYLFDPNQGRRRRAMARDRGLGMMRHGARALGRRVRRLRAWTYGTTQHLTHLRPADTGTPDDVTLTRKVESMVFRDPDVPKGRINLDAVDGVVTIRGELERPEQISALEAEVRRVPGVREVVNLLHLANTPAPHEDNRGAVHVGR